MKQQPNYGYPMFSILTRILLLLLIILFIIMLFLYNLSYHFILLISLIIIPAYVFLGIISFKKHFLNYRIDILKKMIKLADLKGNETVLDLGTGSGFLAINFAKQLKNGKVIGVDRYSLKYENLRRKIIYFLKINFIGHSLKNGMKNLKIEKMEKKCKLISSDLTKPLKFPDKHFDIILSSQTIYCLPPQKRLQVYQEINRVLKKDGEIIFFESKAYIGWDINDLKNYFEKQGYQVNIIPDEKYRGRCILFGKKK